MAAVTPILEEAAGTIPFTIVIISGVDIVLASKGCLETGELNPFGFFCIALGFCDLIDHARIHGRYTPYFLVTTPRPRVLCLYACKDGLRNRASGSLFVVRAESSKRLSFPPFVKK